MKPRGILPTFVTDKQFILCKAPPRIRNAYEIRLALYMAVQSGRTFVLAISHMTMVDKHLEAHIRQHGGELMRTKIEEHSVFVGACHPNGEEGDGWVAGDSRKWANVLAGLRSTWLRERLRVGGSFANDELQQALDALTLEAIRETNVDDEDVRLALMRLISETMHAGGTVVIQ